MNYKNMEKTDNSDIALLIPAAGKCKGMNYQFKGLLKIDPFNKISIIENNIAIAGFLGIKNVIMTLPPINIIRKIKTLKIKSKIKSIFKKYNMRVHFLKENNKGIHIDGIKKMNELGLKKGLVLFSDTLYPVQFIRKLIRMNGVVIGTSKKSKGRDIFILDKKGNIKNILRNKIRSYKGKTQFCWFYDKKILPELIKFNAVHPDLSEFIIKFHKKYCPGIFITDEEIKNINNKDDLIKARLLVKIKQPIYLSSSINAT